jgi:hypothetical protein
MGGMAMATAPSDDVRRRLPTLSEFERAAVVSRLKQIQLERDFPGLTAGQFFALERERISLESKLLAE